jgi:hypothetical protein
MQRLWQHMRSLWPRWTLLPPAPLFLWCAYVFFIRGEHRWELALVMFLAPFLTYFSAATKKLYVGLFPLALVGLLYDSMQFVQYLGITPDRVHDCDLHALDARLFGPAVFGLGDGANVAWPDWFQAHGATALDVYCAIPYGTFIFVSVGYAAYLYFADFTAMRRFAWTFFAFNAAGFLTYHIYPAAPPWYFHTHGCAVDLAAHASEGGRLAHVDSLLGITFFNGLYGRSHDVFGAVPSLHVAYPLLLTFEAWRRPSRAMRAFATMFFLSMCFSAVYLDHHWVIDVLLGITYCSVAYAIVSRQFPGAQRSLEKGAAPGRLGEGELVQLAEDASRGRAP